MNLDVFKAKITAADDTSSVLDVIRGHAKKLGLEFDEVKHKAHGLHEPSIWNELRESVHRTSENFGELGEHVSTVGEHISELIPMVGALGAAGSLVAMLETTEKVAEAYGELAHTAAELGMSAQQLHQWNIVARLSDMNAESMAKSMNRLNITLADAARGKAKDAADLFKHLHLDPKKFKDSADALPALADAFQHTQSAAVRASMAAVLFGARAGKDMIPLLSKGGAAMREMIAEAGKLGFNFGESGEGLEHYNESMKKLGVATDGFKDAIGAELAPVLAPVVDQMTEWVAANRQWIATDLAGEVKTLALWVEHVPWREVGEDVRVWARRAEDFIDEIGGAKTIVEGLAGVMALKGVFFLGRETLAIGKFSLELSKLVWEIGVKLVGAWSEVSGAAARAEAAEIAALEVGGKGGAVAAAEGTAARLAGGAGTGGLGATAIGMGVGTSVALAAGVAAATAVAAGTAYGLKKGLDYIDPRSGSSANMRGGHTGAAQKDLGPRHGEQSAVWTNMLLSSETIQPNMPANGRGRNFGVGSVEYTRLSNPAPIGAPAPGKVEVHVKFDGAPPGVAVSATATGNAAVRVTHPNRAFGDHYGN